MPEPRPGESKDEYISRCIPFLMKKEGKEQKQAAAICYSIWERKNEMNVIDKIDKILNEVSITGFERIKLKDIIRKLYPDGKYSTKPAELAFVEMDPELDTIQSNRKFKQFFKIQKHEDPKDPDEPYYTIGLTKKGIQLAKAIM